MDTLSKTERSRLMASVARKDTAPEISLRKGLHEAGFRFRLHRRDLPGCPDIVLPRYRTAIFVHGCFWHGHGCRNSPRTNTQFWKEKIGRNIERDAKALEALNCLGWRTLVVWECALTGAYRRSRAVGLVVDRLLGNERSSGIGRGDVVRSP